MPTRPCAFVFARITGANIRAAWLLIAVSCAAMFVLLGCETDTQGIWGPLAGDSRAPASTSSETADTAPPPDETVREMNQIAGASDERPRASQEAQEVLLIQVKFDVLRTRAPIGHFSGNGKIWNHLDEEVLPIETRALLNRNGLRAARGRLQSWPAIKAILDHEDDVTTSRTNMSVSNGLPLAIAVDPVPQDQVFYMYRADGTGAGFTYPDCVNHLRVEYHVPYSEPDSVHVAVMPELRMPQDPETIEVTPATERPAGLPLASDPAGE